MSKIEPCTWCLKFIKVPDTFDPNRKKVACSWACYHAELFFTKYYSDEEQYMRQIWKETDDEENL